MTREEIEQRCRIVESGVVIMREPPNNDLATYEALLERAFELGAGFDAWALVIDLSEVTTRPSGRYLERIRGTIREIGAGDGPVHMAVTQPGSAFLRAVLAFVLARISPHVSVQATREGALSACRRKLARR